MTVLAACEIALLLVLVGLVGGLLALTLRRKPVEVTALLAKIDALERGGERAERSLRDESARSREEAAHAARQSREELATSVRGVADSLQAHLTELGDIQLDRLTVFSDRLERLTASNELKLDRLRDTVDDRLQKLQADNGKHQEQMRATVDEKLQSTLEKRLGESFKQVSERLEQVHKGLGEMQSLAIGVGDLKRVLTNVKTRGGWGEVQLGALLDQVLTPEQYCRNAKTREGSDELVEFAIRLPGRSDGGEVLLPIDAKFPTEDYQRLQLAYDAADPVAAEEAQRALAARIKGCAKDIFVKYVNPPRTTDFAVLFLPTEGLYAEVVRNVELVEAVQREYRIVVAGPSNLAALLNSLQMGFRTLAVQRRSSEVWTLLGAVKTDFGRFGDVLDGVRKKLDQAAKTMDAAGRRTRAIERKLRGVEELPLAEARALLEEPLPHAAGDAFEGPADLTDDFSDAAESAEPNA
jgi:DNA recombination protein RmuC